MSARSTSLTMPAEVLASRVLPCGFCRRLPRRPQPLQLRQSARPPQQHTDHERLSAFRHQSEKDPRRFMCLKRRIGSLLLALPIVPLASMSAQAPASSNAEHMTIHVSVTGRNGSAVEGLTKDD